MTIGISAILIKEFAFETLAEVCLPVTGLHGFTGPQPGTPTISGPTAASLIPSQTASDSHSTRAATLQDSSENSLVDELNQLDMDNPLNLHVPGENTVRDAQLSPASTTASAPPSIRTAPVVDDDVSCAFCIPRFFGKWFRRSPKPKPMLSSMH